MYHLLAVKSRTSDQPNYILHDFQMANKGNWIMFTLCKKPIVVWWNTDNQNRTNNNAVVLSDAFNGMPQNRNNTNQQRIWQLFKRGRKNILWRPCYRLHRNWCVAMEWEQIEGALQMILQSTNSTHYDVIGDLRLQANARMIVARPGNLLVYAGPVNTANEQCSMRHWRRHNWFVFWTFNFDLQGTITDKIQKQDCG